MDSILRPCSRSSRKVVHLNFVQRVGLASGEFQLIREETLLSSISTTKRDGFQMTSARGFDISSWRFQVWKCKMGSFRHLETTLNKQTYDACRRILYEAMRLQNAAKTMHNERSRAEHISVGNKRRARGGGNRRKICVCKRQMNIEGGSRSSQTPSRK